MSNAGTDQTPDFPDWKGDFENSVQKEKEAYIREHRLTVWRDHDHMHTHQPDSIFAVVAAVLSHLVVKAADLQEQSDLTI